MTKDPEKRKANNARYYQNKKARQQGQPLEDSEEDSVSDFFSN